MIKPEISHVLIVFAIFSKPISSGNVLSDPSKDPPRDDQSETSLQCNSRPLPDANPLYELILSLKYTQSH